MDAYMILYALFGFGALMLGFMIFSVIVWAFWKAWEFIVKSEDDSE